MALKIDAKLTFKCDIRNLANFHRLKNSDFILESKMVELKKKKFKTNRLTRNLGNK